MENGIGPLRVKNKPSDIIECGIEILQKISQMTIYEKNGCLPEIRYRRGSQ